MMLSRNAKNWNSPANQFKLSNATDEGFDRNT